MQEKDLVHIAGVNVHFSGRFHDMSAILERNFALYRPSTAYAIWVVKKASFTLTSSRY
jgi:hypothetical protein